MKNSGSSIKERGNAFAEGTFGYLDRSTHLLNGLQDPVVAFQGLYLIMMMNYLLMKMHGDKPNLDTQKLGNEGFLCII